MRTYLPLGGESVIRSRIYVPDKVHERMKFLSCHSNTFPCGNGMKLIHIYFRTFVDLVNTLLASSLSRVVETYFLLLSVHCCLALLLSSTLWLSEPSLLHLSLCFRPFLYVFFSFFFALSLFAFFLFFSTTTSSELESELLLVCKSPELSLELALDTAFFLFLHQWTILILGRTGLFSTAVFFIRRLSQINPLLVLSAT